jgi:hypothetical protein
MPKHPRDLSLPPPTHNRIKKSQDQIQNLAESRSNQLFDNLDGETLLTASEIAARLGVATWTIRKWRYEGYLPADTMLKLRHGVKYRWTRVLRWLNTRKV